jgi:hypothetical protein
VRVELFADGVLVDTLDTGNTISTFLVAPFEWSPPAPGPYNLAVRAFSAAAGWSDAAGAGITVDGDLVLPTDRPTESTSPDASRSPSPSPGRTGSPSPTASGRATPTPSAAPGTTPSAGPTSAVPTPTTGPGATPTTGPGPTPTVAPTPTRTPTPTPTPSPTPPPCTPIAPALLSPPDGTTVFDTTQPTLLWEYLEIPACPPSSFRVQVSASRDFSTLLYDEIVASTSWDWTPPSPLADCGTYAWRVFPRRSDGTNGPSTDIWTFTLFVGRCG